MTERWLSVVGFEGSYDVSDFGRVRSLDRTLSDGRRWSGRMLKLSPDADGYAQVNLCVANVQRVQRVSKLVTEAFHGPKPEGMEACHGNGDPSDNRASNLRWDTRSGNMQDALIHGTHNMVRKTHCPLGHQLIEPNLCSTKLARGWRECLSCKKATFVRASDQGLTRQQRADARYIQLGFVLTSELVAA